jgi:hypothetical protein
LSLFDLPNPNLVAAKREVTTSPSQALFLMNNALVQDESLQLTRKVLAEKRASDKERIRKIYLATLLREPTDAEVKRAQAFIKEQTKVLATTPPPAELELLPDPEPTPKPAPVLVASAAPVAAPAGEPIVSDTGGNNRRGAFAPRRPIGPGSDDATAVKKLAPGIARPKTFRQLPAEKPATPQEGAWAQFTQAVFASAEFRYLQ